MYSIADCVETLTARENDEVVGEALKVNKMMISSILRLFISKNYDINLVSCGYSKGNSIKKEKLFDCLH